MLTAVFAGLNMRAVHMGPVPPLLPTDGHVRDVQRAGRAENAGDADRLEQIFLRGQLPQHLIRRAQPQARRPCQG